MNNFHAALSEEVNQHNLPANRTMTRACQVHTIIIIDIQASTELTTYVLLMLYNMRTV